MPQEDKDEEKKDPNDRFANAKKKQWRCKGYVITEEMMLNGIEKREQEATGSKDKEDAKRITRALREKKGIVAAPKEEISKIIEREIRMKKKRDKIERRRARATADYGDEFEGSDVEVDVEATLRAEKEQKKKAKEEDHWDQSKTAARRKAAKEAAEKADAEEAAAAEAEKIAEAHRIEAEEAAKREAKSPKSSKAKRPGSSHGRKGGFNDTLKKVFDRFNDKAVPLESEAAKAAVIGLGLTNRQMQKLKAKFDEIDVDSSGSIDAEELLGEVRAQTYTRRARALSAPPSLTAAAARASPPPPSRPPLRSARSAARSRTRCSR